MQRTLLAIAMTLPAVRLEHRMSAHLLRVQLL
jgi:hypothetical protein